MRSPYILLAWFAVVSACTPEAIEVDPSGGAAGEEPTGSGESGGKGGSAGGGACAPISSPTQSCTECIPQQCPTQASACEATACTCGDYNGYQGQINCMLACATLSPKITAANACASQCGFGSLGNSDRAAHDLFDCLVHPPSGPPVCPDCFPFH